MSSIFQSDKPKYPKPDDPNSFLVREKERIRDVENQRLEEQRPESNFLIESNRRQMERARANRNAADYNLLFVDTRPQTKEDAVIELRQEIAALQKKVSFLESEKK